MCGRPVAFGGRGTQVRTYNKLCASVGECDGHGLANAGGGASHDADFFGKPAGGGNGGEWHCGWVNLGWEKGRERWVLVSGWGRLSTEMVGMKFGEW